MLLQMALFVFFLNNWAVFHCVYVFFIFSSVDGHLDFFHVLVILNSAAINIGVHGDVCIFSNYRVFSRYMPRSEIAGSYGNLLF